MFGQSEGSRGRGQSHTGRLGQALELQMASRCGGRGGRWVGRQVGREAGGLGGGRWAGRQVGGGR